jgi:hypothetical protein
MPHPGEPNLRDAAAVIDLLGRAAEANLRSPMRHGSTVDLPDRGRLVMSGDLHDNSRNYRRLVNLAALDKGNHYLILHELIHGGHLVNGRDMSARLLFQAAALKVRYPEQVHILQSNHELAQVRGEDILKAGGSVIQAFGEGLEFMFGDEAAGVHGALARFVLSLPLAVRCPRGILCSHSLPSMRHLETFDPEVLKRTPTDADLAPGGSAYQMVWGRSHQEALAQRLGKAWGVRLFVTGHQPAEMGHEVESASILVLASDHEHGVALPIELSRDYTMDELVEALVPLGAVADAPPSGARE